MINEYWLLDREITFLNHGSFGACPIPVLEAQTSFREQLEREPLRFLMREFEPLLDNARNQLGAFIGASEEELAFVPNATTGVNAVLRSLFFAPGDELLTTNQEYNACRNTLDFIAERTGAKVIVAEIPFPIESPQQIIEAIIKCVSPQTKLALLDHIVSQTGLIFPIKQLVGELANRGIDVLVDGAHAPGMVALNLAEIGAAYYTGNCHKWLCAPKGAAFLYVRRDKQQGIRPTTISHGANSPRADKSRFQLEFDWMGTVDPSPYLCVPTAIDFMGSLLSGGWPELMAKNHALALAARQILADKLDLPLPCPDEMVGAMAVIPLGDQKPDAVTTGGIPPLQELLWEIFKIEVPVIPWPDSSKRLVRISAQFYNTLPQYEYLAKALVELTER
ncbi:aminotransferase class V-fold PLP-dependent enzyme [Microcoleus sp. bin38.metabat.b11b12b14.051]|uniref:aminotransferase class V-fold PLP-dependent enzyme n=1 Tax=Microcoleus sp. bin38.metabat.b11b12b14.051 TaxID=2742709 RepID=UPI0025FD1FFC|nr:aminotransferase class V-fold PLP-dependent enzyme [Microcoleus sp. bin38.metabat.b11b12b14.051]